MYASLSLICGLEGVGKAPLYLQQKFRLPMVVCIWWWVWNAATIKVKLDGSGNSLPDLLYSSPSINDTFVGVVEARPKVCKGLYPLLVVWKNSLTDLWKVSSFPWFSTYMTLYVVLACNWPAVTYSEVVLLTNYRWCPQISHNQEASKITLQLHTI